VPSSLTAIRDYSGVFEGFGVVFAIVALNVVAKILATARVRPLARSLLKEIQNNLAVKSFGRTDPADAVLTAKFLDVNTRAEHHLEMVIKLGELIYMQVLMLLVTSGVAAIALFILSREGWKSDNLPLLILFAVTAAAATIYAAASRIFRVNDNFRANALAYTQILQLSDQIRTYSFTRGVDGVKSLAAFLDAIDKSLAAFRTVAFSFDLTQAPTVSALLSELVSASKKPKEPEDNTGKNQGTAPEEKDKPQSDRDNNKIEAATA
jgi:hypothetical protein